MPRYERSYAGERRTTSVRVKLTPTEKQALEAAAAPRGGNVSDYVREICLVRRGGAPPEVRRNPEARRLMEELRAIGNNLNQIARHANVIGEVGSRDELSTTLRELQRAMARVIAL
ncbi:MAG TPA: plasmid mobilization relaxosome protein MobC [Xanthobacteraceae bacterium]|nr:plasmid mobilization relaxosome protein MobC [Xanthobacteraceae bacterium]